MLAVNVTQEHANSEVHKELATYVADTCYKESISFITTLMA